MKGFKKIFSESNPETRRAMGVYPPYPGDVFARPSYSQNKFCKKILGQKLVNMDTSQICGKKKS